MFQKHFQISFSKLEVCRVHVNRDKLVWKLTSCASPITPTPGKLPQVDMTQQTHPALADDPVLSSDQSGWQGIFFHHYDHPAYESPEHQWRQHIIGIIGRGGHPVESQHRLDGQVHCHHCYFHTKALGKAN